MRNEFLKLKIVIILFFLISLSFFPLISSSKSTHKLISPNLLLYEKNLSNDSECYAIIIGIEFFSGLVLKNNYIGKTAKELYKTLLSGDNWNNENIKLLLNENATKNNIKNSIVKWLASKENKNDKIVIYFIGNSYRIPLENKSSGNAYILPYDINNTEYNQNKITDFELNNWINTLDSRHISIIFDTQYSGYMNKLKKIGRVLITSNNKHNSNFNKEFNNKGIFSKYLIEGLSGYADYNNDEKISIFESFRYLKNKCILNYLYILKNFIINGNNSDILNHQIPSIYNLHFGELFLISLSYGWKQITDDGFGKSSNYATRGMAIFNDELYIGTQNNQLYDLLELDDFLILMKLSKFYELIKSMDLFDNVIRSVMRIILHSATFASQGCEIWKYNYSSDSMNQIIGDNSISGIQSGFNYSFNAAASIMKVFKGYLYVGTWNTPIGSIENLDRKGCEIWRTSNGILWEQVVGENSLFTKGGFGNPDNVGAWSIEEFNGWLYVGTMNWDFTDMGGCEIWRSSDGLIWEQVVKNGFRSFMDENILFEPVNTYAWIMKVFKDHLYVGTFNSRTRILTDKGTGGQLWRTSDGVEWNKVDLPDGSEGGFQDGFGESENYGIRKLTIYNEELYIGVASSFLFKNGCEIWKYDGMNWNPIISDEVIDNNENDIHYDGFGNSKNKYIWSMESTSDGKLWVGTANVQIDVLYLLRSIKFGRLLDSLTDGFEIWCYDGLNWTAIVKNDLGKKSNGIGDSFNLGARSMIEYPENSGNIVVGTFKMLKNNPPINGGGCELWIHFSD
jgi:hypothetical protein